MPLAFPPVRQVAVTARLEEPQQAALASVLSDVAELVYVTDESTPQRRRAIQAADALITWHPERELGDDLDCLADVGLVQLISAGVDHLPFDRIPAEARIAANAGAYADPMAEHALAMILALAKWLVPRHEALHRGEFPRDPTTRLAGSTVAILGYGGFGRAVARLLRPFDVTIAAINTSGQTDDDVAFCGTLDDLEEVLGRAGVVVVALPLTKRTRGLLGEQELRWLRPDVILVNLARGPIVDQGALYRFLRVHPEARAGIDAWWDEPRDDEEFRLDHPLFELPNFLGSPHNSALAEGALADGARHAAENVRRHLEGGEVRGLVHPGDYVD